LWVYCIREAFALRVKKAWEAKDLQPIGLHECRHTAATWLDAAGVSPKVVSVLMGHATPERQPGAAEITLARYTHVIPDAIETARAQLDVWLEAQLAAPPVSATLWPSRPAGYPDGASSAGSQDRADVKSIQSQRTSMRTSRPSTGTKNGSSSTGTGK